MILLLLPGALLRRGLTHAPLAMCGECKDLSLDRDAEGGKWAIVKPAALLVNVRIRIQTGNVGAGFDLRAVRPLGRYRMNDAFPGTLGQGPCCHVDGDHARLARHRRTAAE